MPKIADRLTILPPYAFAVLEGRMRAMKAQGIDIIRLDVGNPDLPPPSVVVEALTARSVRDDAHGYTGYRGTAEFRAAVVEYYAKRFGVPLDPDRHVLPLLGSKEGIVNLTLAYCDNGDSVLIPQVAYPSYESGALMAHARPLRVPFRSEDDLRIDMGALARIVEPTSKLLWVNYPNNPTGAVVDLSHYEELLAFCRQHDLILASDNPYVDVTFDGYRAPSPLQLDGAIDHTVEFISCSKSYNMAGWRLGAAVGSEAALRALLQIKSNVDSGHFQPIYDAGVVALTGVPADWMDARNAIYQRRRDLLVDALPHIGLRGQATSGSLYVWARVIDGNGSTYAEAAINEAHVSVAPGIIYGEAGRDHVRLSLGTPDARLIEAIDRLKDWHSARQ